ncbi:FadR/GntR family transcriptional regulator [Paramicrobacterium agarici]|uniref:FadR/GntR family transcriptional regulator n=1 Tax=Paramicrobacterium agarici TaxID=630514 RepID=UPI00114DD576|nr:FadR/GntR family transcriptional regulator [Microbacterium agarici]TQO22346.1 DNA-binding FadR family transcriptional regulator [Microbacterium agarici]
MSENDPRNAISWRSDVPPLPPPRTRFNARKRHGLYDRVVDVIGQQIVTGELPVGSIIYAEQVCEQLDISRSVVREGIRTLSSMGLVESRPQRGTRVQPRDQWDLLNPHVVQWRGEGSEYLQQMYELLELRLGIEHAAAHFAALRMSDGDREAVVAAGYAMQRAYENRDPHTFFMADADLHRLMLEGTGNAVIGQFADTVSTALHIRGSNASRSYSTAQSLDALSAGRHVELAEALARRDPDAAQKAVNDIMFATLTEVQNLLEARNSTAANTNSSAHHG